MLASGLSEIALNSTLPLQNHVVPVDQLRAPKVAENLGDFTALAADDGLGLLMVVGGEPAADLDAFAVPDDTASPRSKLPSTRVTPAGSRLLPEASACAAPSSTMTAPLGSSVPAIQRFRAVTGSERARNQVAAPFLASA